MSESIRQLPDWELWTAAGLINDLSLQDRHGRRTGIDSTEVTLWTCDNNEPALPGAAVTMYASSEDASAVGTFLVGGLGPDWTQKQGLVTLNGQTQEAITDLNGDPTTFRALTEAWQVSDRTVNEPTADVWFAKTSTLTSGKPLAGDQELRVIFTNAAQKAEKTWFMVPSGKVAFLVGWDAEMSEASGASRHATVGVEVSELSRGATVGNPSWAPRRRVDELTVSTSHISESRKFLFPRLFPEMTILEVRATASATSALSGHLAVLLADE